MREKDITRIILIFVFAFLVDIGSVVQAAVIDVTTRLDIVPGSLRAAITTANINNEDDTIYLPAGRYHLSGEAYEDDNVEGDLDIDTTHRITIIGEGMTTTFIDGNQIDRVLHILDGTVSISGVTILNGKTRDGDFALNGENGGGIYNCAILILNNCCIKNNRTGGDGFYLLEEDDDIHWFYGGGHGGGIYNKGTLTINNCSIHNNITGSGGAYLMWPGDGGDGGGICNNGTLVLTNSSINKNTTGDAGETDFYESRSGIPGYGGGICNYGDLNITNCSICDNVTGSSFLNWDISTNGGGSGGGGGILNKGDAELKNCTISNNKTGNGGDSWSNKPGDGGDGGGIFNWGTLTLISCTVSINKTGSGGESDNDKGRGGDGGGIYNLYPETVHIKNTIVADNQVAEEGEGPDCFGQLHSHGYNLIEDISQSSIYGYFTGNITEVDPMLAAPADNGGPTKTCALLPGSPAMDTGISCSLSEDQRGYSRPVDLPGILNVSDGSDIGAYEFDASYNISGKITDGTSVIADVTLTFSNSAGSTTTDEKGNYSHPVIYGWSGTVTPSKQGYIFIPASRNYSNVTTDHTNQDYKADLTIPPQLAINRTQMNFGVDTAGNQTGDMTFIITNSGGGILDWRVNTSTHWLDCTPTSGSESAIIKVSIDPSGLTPGTYVGTITVESHEAINSPQTIDVTLNLYTSGSTTYPFGSFDTPIDSSTVMSSIPVTGWVLDDIGVASVKIYREAVSGEGGGGVYIGDAVLVEGARPDVETAYPGYPNNYKAGWGYMMLTNFLPNQGNGTFILYVNSEDREGNVVTLGTKTIYCDNAHAVKPFGAIDTPGQGGTASGSSYVNFGWALTPLPNTIPTDGSTIMVWVDGIARGHSVYNQYREDIAALFPGYNNSTGAGGHFYLDTTPFENGVHTIQWTVTDAAGNTDGIGSRYFTIHNNSHSAKRTAHGVLVKTPDISQIPVNYFKPLKIKKGYEQNIEPQIIYPDDTGNITIEIRELQRVEIHFSTGILQGFQVIGNHYKKLPIGSTLVREIGLFNWQPGPGYLGNHELVFIEQTETSEMKKIHIIIRIVPFHNTLFSP